MATMQRIVNGDSELHPCYPSGQYCPENSLSNACAQVVSKNQTPTQITCTTDALVLLSSILKPW